jgi:hypothetical protein
MSRIRGFVPPLICVLVSSRPSRGFENPLGSRFGLLRLQDPFPNPALHRSRVWFEVLRGR